MSYLDDIAAQRLGSTSLSGTPDTSQLDQIAQQRLVNVPSETSRLDAIAAQRLGIQSNSAPTPQPKFDSGPGLYADKGDSTKPLQQQSPSNLDVNKPTEQSVAETLAPQIESGLHHNLAGIIGLKAASALGMPIEQAYPNAHPGLLSLSTAVSFADPAALGIFKGVEAPVNFLFSKLGGTPTAIFKTSGAGMATAAENAAQSFGSKVLGYVGNTLAPTSLKGGLGVAGAELAKDTLESSGENVDGKAAMLSTLNKSLANFATGAILSPAIHVAADGILKSAALFGKASDSVGNAQASFDYKPNSPQKIQEVHDSYVDALYTAKVRVADGSLSEDQLSTKVAQLFQENLEQRGVKPTAVGMPGGLTSTFANPEAVFTNIDKNLGTNTTGIHDALFSAQNKEANIASNLVKTVTSPIKNLNKLGVGSEDITRLMSYVEDAQDGSIIFNPESRFGEGFSRPEWTAPAPNEAVMNELRTIRHTMTSTMVNDPEYAGMAGFRDGYFPAMSKTTGVLENGRSSTRSIYDPSFTQERWGEIDPTTHEMDAGVVLNGWANKYAKFAAYRDVLPKAAQQWQMLSAIGDKESSNYFLSTLKNAFNIRDSKEVGALFGENMLNNNAQFIEDITKGMPQKKAFGTQIVQLLRNQFYNRTVFENPSVFLKHIAQPEFVAGAEMGYGNLERGTSGLLLNKELQKVAAEELPNLKKTDISNEIVGNKPDFDSKGLEVANKLMGITSIPGRKALNSLDTFNRKRVFLGGYLQAKEAFSTRGEAGLLAATKNLNPGQRVAVMDTLKEKGIEAAARKYGQIRSYRSQWAYGIANTPAAFQGKLASYMPFTSWSSNEFSNIMGDISMGNYGSLAKKAAIPLLGIWAMKQLTGYQVSNAHPFTAVAEALQPGANPWLKPGMEIAKPILNGEKIDATKIAKSLTSALEPLTPYKTFDSAMTRNKQSHGDALETLLKLKKSK